MSSSPKHVVPASPKHVVVHGMGCRSCDRASNCTAPAIPNASFLAWRSAIRRRRDRHNRPRLSPSDLGRSTERIRMSTNGTNSERAPVPGRRAPAGAPVASEREAQRTAERCLPAEWACLRAQELRTRSFFTYAVKLKTRFGADGPIRGALHPGSGMLLRRIPSPTRPPAAPRSREHSSDVLARLCPYPRALRRGALQAGGSRALQRRGAPSCRSSTRPPVALAVPPPRSMRAFRRRAAR